MRVRSASWIRVGSLASWVAVFAACEANQEQPLDAGGEPPTDRYDAIDPRPFGHHPAIAHREDFPDDPYAPAREAGLAWTRGGDAPYLFWSMVDREGTGDPSRMKWTDISTIGPDRVERVIDYDRGISEALAAKLHVMWNIDVGPDPTHRKANSWLPTDEAAYERFVEASVARYPSVRVWQVGNEPNLGPDRDRADFARFYKLTFDAIRRADSSALVVMAGVAGNMRAGVDDNDDYFDSVLDELGGCCVDVFDFHFYGDARGGTLESHDGSFYLGYQDMESVAAHYRAHLDARGYSATPLWTTENGTPSGLLRAPDGFHEISEAEQAREVPKRTVVALAAGVDKLFWAFGMSDGFGPWDDDFFDRTGFIHSTYGHHTPQKKLAYYALWQMTRQLADCRWQTVRRIETAAANTRAYRCDGSKGGEIVVAWWDTFLVPDYDEGDTVTVEVPWSGATAVSRAAVPTASDGASVVDPASSFATSTSTPSSGKIAIVLGADPVFVRAE